MDGVRKRHLGRRAAEDGAAADIRSVHRPRRRSAPAPSFDRLRTRLPWSADALPLGLLPSSRRSGRRMLRPVVARHGARSAAPGEPRP